MLFGFTNNSFYIFGLEITFYGFLIALGMALGVFVACKNTKLRGLSADDLVLAACYVLPLAILGARLYYVIFSDRSYTFGEIFRIWDGGLAVLGGVIGGAIGVMLFCLIHKKNFLDVADVIAPSLILGQAIGRIGCYFAGCCYGITVTDENLTWFPLSTFIDGQWRLSTFFYESVWNFVCFAILLILLRKNKYKYRGSSIAMYFILYGIGRAWIEALRGDSLYIGTIKVSQLLSILMVIGGIVMICLSALLVKKGRIKSVAQLRPIWQNNIEEYKKLQEQKEKERKEKKELKKQQKLNKQNQDKAAREEKSPPKNKKE